MAWVNAPGIGLLLVSTAIGNRFHTHPEQTAFYLPAALVMIVGDLALRFHAGRKLTRKALLNPDQGGQVARIPCWAIGILWLVIGLFYMVTAPAIEARS